MGIPKIGANYVKNCKFCTQFMRAPYLMFRGAPKNIDFSSIRYAPNLRRCTSATSKFQKSKTPLPQETKAKFENLFNMLCGKFNQIKPLQTEFCGLKQARQYAKKRSMQAAFESENPYEHMVIIEKKTHRVTGEYKGDRHSVMILGKNVPEGASISHGHPINTTDGSRASTPISYQDFVFLNDTRAEDIIAYNENGEFSMLIKKPNFRPLTKEQIDYYDTKIRDYVMPEKEFFAFIRPKLPQELRGVATYADLKSLIQKLKKMDLYTKKLQELCQQAEKKVKKCGMEEIKAMHRFFLDFADELGVTYKTNYSYL